MFERIAAMFYTTLGFSVGIAIGLITGAFIAAVFWSYWGWFLVPIGAPQISYFHAWGLLVMFGLFIPQLQLVGTTEEKETQGLRVLLSVALAWPVGFILHLAV